MPNQAVITDGAGELAVEAQLGAVRGGTGTDSSASDGIAHVTEGVWTYSPIVNQDVSLTADIARSKLASGTPGAIVVNNGLGVMSETAQIGAAQGGTGTNSSVANGIAHVTVGAWTYSPIVNADVDTNAAIARGKLAVGAANAVVINDGLGVMTAEAQLGAARGGTGTNSSAATGIAHVSAGAWSYSPIVASDIGTLSSITVGTINALADLTLAPVGNIVFSAPTIQPASGLAGGASASYSTNLQTASNVPAALWSIAPATNSVLTVRAEIALVDTVSTDSGSYVFAFKAVNLAGVVTVSAAILSGSILDGTTAATSVLPGSAGATAVVNVTGVAGSAVKWVGRFDVVSQLI